MMRFALTGSTRAAKCSWTTMLARKAHELAFACPGLWRASQCQANWAAGEGVNLELQNLDKAVWQAQSAASHTGGGGGSYTSSAAITGIVHSVPGEGMMEATSSHRPLVGARRGTSSLAANNISLRKQMPAATPVSAVAAGGVTAQSISAVETPWTGTNTGLPAYPSQSTPQMPAKPTGRWPLGTLPRLQVRRRAGEEHSPPSIRLTLLHLAE
eukprot:scaffold46550_cov17-Tisochrysis_lutea.AAC.2